MTEHTHAHAHAHRSTPAFGVSASPTLSPDDWSVTVTFAPPIGWGKADFLEFDRYMRKAASNYLNAPVGGTNAGPNA